jgi:hypothetical protein
VSSTTTGRVYERSSPEGKARVSRANSTLPGVIKEIRVTDAITAFINAVEHPTDKSQNTIDVTGEISPQDVVLHIRDHGQALSPKLTEHADRSRERQTGFLAGGQLAT